MMAKKRDNESAKCCRKVKENNNQIVSFANEVSAGGIELRVCLEHSKSWAVVMKKKKNRIPCTIASSQITGVETTAKRAIQDMRH